MASIIKIVYDMWEWWEIYEIFRNTVIYITVRLDITDFLV